MRPEEENLIEAACSAWRPESRDGTLRYHPAWHDLDTDGREQVYARTAQLRAMEAALDEGGLSSTARAVLARIQAAGGR